MPLPMPLPRPLSPALLLLLLALVLTVDARLEEGVGVGGASEGGCLGGDLRGLRQVGVEAPGVREWVRL